MISPRSYIRLGLCIFSLSILYVILYRLPFAFFSYHPLLILVALAACTEGVASLQESRIVSEQKRSSHAILQGAAFTAMTCGFSVIYINKDNNNKAHFTTIHGQLGAVTYLFICFQLFVGTLAVYVPGVFGGVARAKSMYRYHRILGYVLLVMVWITALYGAMTPFLLKCSFHSAVNWFSIATIAIGIFQLLQPNRLCSPKKHN